MLKNAESILKRGIYPVVHTPLLPDESIDFNGINASIDYYLNSDISGVTVLGSGGELPYFSDDEQYQIVKASHERLANKKLIIAGVNAQSSKQALQKISSYAPYVDCILLLLNDYYQTSFNDYYHAIKKTALASEKPILFYYFPQITGKYLSATQLIQLLNIDNIIGIKDSSLHLPTACQILARKPTTLYFTGLSLLLKPLIDKGAAGAICPIATVIPKQAQAYFDALDNKNQHNIKMYHQVLKHTLPVVNNVNISAKLQFTALNLLSRSPIPLLKTVTSSHANIKAALNTLGLPIQAIVRSPLPELSIIDSRKIESILKNSTEENTKHHNLG